MLEDDVRRAGPVLVAAQLLHRAEQQAVDDHQVGGTACQRGERVAAQTPVAEHPDHREHGLRVVGRERTRVRGRLDLEALRLERRALGGVPHEPHPVAAAS